MFVLNIEDDIYKHNDICNVMKKGSFSNLQIDCEHNLADAIEKIAEQNDLGKPYDLIITDMWYPSENGGIESESGEMLIETVRDNNWNIPIILCSSVRYRIPEILGTVHYSKNGDWESELLNLAKKVNV